MRATEPRMISGSISWVPCALVYWHRPATNSPRFTAMHRNRWEIGAHVPFVRFVDRRLSATCCTRTEVDPIFRTKIWRC